MDSKLLEKNMKLFLISFLSNKYSVIAITSVIIQQLIVGGSILSLVEIGKNVATNTISWTPWVLFVLCLTIVYIPGVIYMAYTQKAKNLTFYNFVLEITTPIKAKASSFGDPDIEKKIRPWLTSESYQLVDDTYTYFFSIIATILNVVVSIAAIGIGIGTHYIVAYLLGITLVWVLSKVFNQTIKNLSKNMQESKDKLVHHLSETFPNIILGNQVNENTWIKNYNKLWNGYNNSSFTMFLKVNVLSSLSILILLAPVLVTVFYDLKYNLNNQIIGILAATLPRQVQLIQSIFHLIHDVNMVSSVMGRLENIKHLFVPLKNPSKYIRFDKIQTFENNVFNTFDNLDEVCNFLSQKKSRYTIKGENGAGKSVLLRSLKEKFGNKAFYLPVENSMLHFEDISKALSSGQRVKYIIEKLIPEKLDYLLLDEWDANLDTNNKVMISKLLDSIKHRVSIIEIRHS